MLPERSVCGGGGAWGVHSAPCVRLPGHQPMSIPRPQPRPRNNLYTGLSQRTGDIDPMCFVLVCRLRVEPATEQRQVNAIFFNLVPFCVRYGYQVTILCLFRVPSSGRGIVLYLLSVIIIIDIKHAKDDYIIPTFPHTCVISTLSAAIYTAGRPISHKTHSLSLCGRKSMR